MEAEVLFMTDKDFRDKFRSDQIEFDLKIFNNGYQIKEGFSV